MPDPNIFPVPGDPTYEPGGAPPPAFEPPREFPPGYPTTPGQVWEPAPDNYWYVKDPFTGVEAPASWDTPGAFWSETAYTSAMIDYQDWLKGEANRARGYGYGAGGGGPSPAEIAAMNLSNYANAVIAGIEAEISAGRLSLEQAQLQFDARISAFAEAGKQRSEMWKWTVPPGSEGKPLHADIRGRLDMEPWISQPVTIDPFAEAQQIVESMPEVSPVPSTEELDELIALAKGLL